MFERLRHEKTLCRWGPIPMLLMLTFGILSCGPQEKETREGASYHTSDITPRVSNESLQTKERSVSKQKIESPLNFILVIIDTLRADHLGCYGHSRNTTPNIDLLAKRSHRFTNTISPAPWTRSAIASIVTSKWTLEHGIQSESPQEILSDQFYTIQEFFNDRGYTTAAFITNPHLSFGLTQSFGSVDYQGDGHAAPTYNKVLKWLDTHGNEKFFLLVHNNDPHDRYFYHEQFNFTKKESKWRVVKDLYRDVPGEVNCRSTENLTVLKDAELAEMKGNYDGEIAYTDHQLGRLLNRLKKRGLDKNTVVVVTADHGEEFLDHGRYFHGCTLYNELLHVPLIVHIPGRDQGVHDQLVSTVDIFPTVVDLLDRPKLASYRFSGRSLIPIIENRPQKSNIVFSSTGFRGDVRYSLTVGNHKLISSDQRVPREIFDIRRDPRETKNLIDNTQLTKRLTNQLNRFIAGIDHPKDQPERSTPTVKDELKKQLEALGYIAE